MVCIRCPCVWRIRNCHLETIIKTVLFLSATFPTVPCHDGSAGTPRTSTNNNRQIPGSRRFESRRRRQFAHETAAPGYQLIPVPCTQSLGARSIPVRLLVAVSQPTSYSAGCGNYLTFGPFEFSQRAQETKVSFVVFIWLKKKARSLWPITGPHPGYS